MLRRAQLAVFADFGETFVQLNLRPGQFAALTVIDRNHGMTQSEVCAALGIQHSNFVTVIHDLERRGLVRRTSSAADRRSKALELTLAGRRVLERAAGLQRIHEARIARRLGPGGREQLLRLLGATRRHRLSAIGNGASMTSTVAAVEYVDRIAVVTVSNPPVNTLSIAVRDALNRALDELDARAGLRGAVLMCSGSTFFSGADISEFSGPPQEEAYRALFNRLEGAGRFRSSRRCTARCSAAGSRSRSPVITGSRSPARASACRRSRSASSRARAARSACRG